MIKVTTATNTKILKVLSSNFKCIKIVRTNQDFIAAIKSAIVIVNLPKSIPATATVVPVKASKANQAKK